MDVEIIQQAHLQKKLGEHVPCGYSMPKIGAFNGVKPTIDVCRGTGCMKAFCKSWEEYAIGIINFEIRRWFR